MTNKLFLVEFPVFFQIAIYIAGTNTTSLSGFSNVVQSFLEKTFLCFTGFIVFAFIAASLVISVQNCNSISKREAVRADPAQGLLSYGPIKIEVPSRPHSSKLLFLQHNFNGFKHVCRHSCKLPPRCCSCGIYVALVGWKVVMKLIYHSYIML